MPVYSGSKYLGCVSAGQVFFRKYTSLEKAAYMKYITTLGGDSVKASIEFDKTRIVSKENIKMAVKFLKLIVKFIADVDREEAKLTPSERKQGKKTPEKQLLEGVKRIRAGRYAAIISRVKENMDTFPSSSISLKEAASIAGMSPCHFSRIYKETTGRKFRDYTCEQRIEHSKILLNNPDKKISDIAERCGYRETSSFSRAFNKMTGEYPGSYRARKAEKAKTVSEARKAEKASTGSEVKQTK
ncbi:MAG: hypothetical protein A2231_05355 [Candidatus Firestonebacteria bacterium RIFOXYA2_FULL_40_8]|nr:MAG: hypothetical protein A2231_05355 [Candidatus Firestonebacteria bacterium RIFOXYA2_FULL_40_8]